MKIRAPLVAIIVYQVSVVVLYAGGFLQGVTAFEAMDQVALDYPWSSEHFGIFNRDLPVDHVPFPRQLFDNMHGVAVDRAVLAEPCLIHEISDVDDHGIAFPVANGVSVKRRIESRVMLPAIRGDHAKGVLFRRVDRV